MAQDARETLNIGSGFNKMLGAINLDRSASCNPDVVWDINDIPWPFEDGRFIRVNAFHIIEHLTDYWPVISECARVLEPGGILEIHVPHASSDSALTYRDHYRMIGSNSFHGIQDTAHGTSAWAWDEKNTVPLMFVDQYLVPFKQYEWMARWCPHVLHFCAKHLRNFVWEHQFIFKRV